MDNENLNTLFKSGKPDVGEAAPTQDIQKHGMAAAQGTFDDAELLELWQKIRRECIDTRLVFERQWHRNILYTLGRQWIEYHGNGNVGEWKDKRLAQWVPRPVTNKCKEVVQSIRAFFTSVQLGATVRPNGNDPKNVAAAYTADELLPLLHESHDMNTTLNEFDFWLLVCGNAFLHTFLDYDIKHGVLNDPSETCAACGVSSTSSEISDAGNACPACSTPAQGNFTPTLDDNGQPVLNSKPKGVPATIALSPLEVAFSNTYHRWSDLPYVVRLRWRSKSYYENHPVLKDLVPEISWEKGSGDLSLQLFRALTQHNDLGLAPQYLMGSELSGSDREDGITEYEIHYKPCDAYPGGLVFRVVGDKEGGRILHLDDEQLPGPLPYQDAEGKPLFTFAHAAYEHVGGRILGSGPIDHMIQKQDQLNQLDSMILMIVNRMANPIWLWPKGSDPGKMNGMPGLVVTWDPLTVGGQAKPERIAGQEVQQSLFVLRQQYLDDIEQLTGTFDIMKGQKPAGVEAFSALQLLDERSKGRFAPVLTARGEVYKDWAHFALELERKYGEDERTKAVQLSARLWTFENFKRAQLDGAVAVVVENGSTVPKTSLGMRAALDHAHQMGLINFSDSDQSYEALKLMGLTRMIPALDINIQAALQKQDAFEKWATDKTQQAKSMSDMQNMIQQSQQNYQQALAKHLQIAPNTPAGQPLPQLPEPPQPPQLIMFTPLRWKTWYSAPVHMQEFLKWANSDTMRALLAKQPGLEIILEQHMQAIQAAMPAQPAQPPKIAFNFAGPDLALQPVEGLFARSTGQQPQVVTPRPTEAAPQPRVPNIGKGGHPVDAMEGAGRGMRNSNQNSGKPGAEA